MNIGMAKLIQTRLTIGALWSPLSCRLRRTWFELRSAYHWSQWSLLEFEIMNTGMVKLIQTVLKWEPIGVHMSPSESIRIADVDRLESSWDRLTIVAHLSPLELDIINICIAKLIQRMLTSRAHWCPLELQIKNDLSWAETSLPLEPIKVHWSWRLWI